VKLLADLLLVDGNPLAEISLLQDRKRLLAIMKDGVFHKPPPLAREQRAATWRRRLSQGLGKGCALAIGDRPARSGLRDQRTQGDRTICTRRFAID
jgi:hypothetical protein